MQCYLFITSNVVFTLIPGFIYFRLKYKILKWTIWILKQDAAPTEDDFRFDYEMAFSKVRIP